MMRPSRNAQRSAAAVIVEWRPGGHRLAYVRCLVLAAQHVEVRPVLITTSQLLESSEYAVQLRDLADADVFDVRLDDTLSSRDGLMRQLQQLRSSAGTIVLPEADRFLPAVVVAKFRRRLPRRLSLIVMRSPGTFGIGLRNAVARLTKTASIVVLSCFRQTVAIRLLEDPLATRHGRTWPWPLASSRLRLDDPNLVALETPERPAELAALATDCRVMSMLGAIDDRKRLPEVLDAWAAIPPDAQRVLVVAGRMTARVRAQVDAQLVHIANVVVIDRYMSTGELRWVLERSNGVVALYDGGMSSGVVTATAAFGRWLVAPASTRCGRIAREHGFGVTFEDRPGALAEAMQNVLGRDAAPSPVPVPSPVEFGRRAWGSWAM